MYSPQAPRPSELLPVLDQYTVKALQNFLLSQISNNRLARQFTIGLRASYLGLQQCPEQGPQTSENAVVGWNDVSASLDQVEGS